MNSIDRPLSVPPYRCWRRVPPTFPALVVACVAAMGVSSHAQSPGPVDSKQEAAKVQSQQTRSATAQQLPAVTVTGAAIDEGLGLSRSTTSGSRTGITTQELPASLDSVDSQTWEERGDSRMADIVGRTVGMTPLSATSYNSLSFSSRGFTGTNSVGIAEDGARLSVAATTTPYPGNGWGYERVEVLRGPASIVYGTGSVGGVVNIVRKQPSRTPAREAMIGGGSYGTGKLGLGLGGPVNDVVSYRVDAYGDYTDGERDLARAHSGKVMSTLRVEPHAALRFELLADISNSKPARYFGTPALDGRVVRHLRGENYNSSDSTIFFRDRRFRARANWQANDWLTIRNETYHFSADRHWRNIEGYRYNPGVESVSRFDYIEVGHDLEQTGNRLEADFDLGAHKLVAGWEVHRARFTHSVNSPYGGASEVSAINPIHGVYDSPDPFQPFLASRLTAHDLYLEDAWRVHDRWLLLGGIRRDLNDMSRHEFASGAGFGKKLHGTAWRLGATYRITDDTHAYAQVSRGHDPVTNILTLNLANRDFKLTTARQFEIGLKQQFGQGLGEWTAAIYQIEKKDIITRHPDEPTVAVQGGKQRSHGIELSAMLRPHANWRLEGNYALTNARFKTLIEPGGLDRSGNRPANVPRHSANLWVHYLTDSPVGQWQASLGARMVGSRYANNANSVKTGGYTVWDASVSWHPRHDTRVQLTVRNLTNKLYTYSAISGSQAYLGDKRRFDLMASFAF